jgi:signal transduction histidine kinase
MNRGVFVREPSARDIRDLFGLRRILETAAMRAAGIGDLAAVLTAVERGEEAASAIEASITSSTRSLASSAASARWKCRSAVATAGQSPSPELVLAKREAVASERLRSANELHDLVSPGWPFTRWVRCRLSPSPA